MPMRHFVTAGAPRLKTSIAQRPTGAIVSGHMISRRRFLGGSVAPRRLPPRRSQRGGCTRIGVLSGASQQWVVPMLDAFPPGIVRSGLRAGALLLRAEQVIQ